MSLGLGLDLMRATVREWDGFAPWGARFGKGMGLGLGGMGWGWVSVGAGGGSQMRMGGSEGTRGVDMVVGGYRAGGEGLAIGLVKCLFLLLLF